MTPEPDSIVAVARCGCIRGACVDYPEFTKTQERSIGRWVRLGYRIERRETAWLRENLWTILDCPEHGRASDGDSEQAQMFG